MRDAAELLGFADYLHTICVEAGEEILAHYDSSNAKEHTLKSDDSPLTSADLASHHLLTRKLAQFDLPVLSEETPLEQMESRHDWSSYWLIDPLDGTREFVERTGEFTINIALIEHNRARLGAIYLPLAHQFFYGGAGIGAWLREQGRERTIRCRQRGDAGELLVLTSRRHRGQQLENFLGGIQGEGYDVKRTFSGSALKFCDLAQGQGDIYPRFAPCSEWDTAAGQALVEGAGGYVLDLSGEPLLYNTRETLLNPFFIAWGDAPGNLGGIGL